MPQHDLELGTIRNLLSEYMDSEAGDVCPVNVGI